MERNKIIPPITLFVVFLLLSGMPKITESQFRAPPMPGRPLCLSQFALASHACSLLPYGPNPYEPPPPSDEPDEFLHVDSDHQDNGQGNRNNRHGSRNGNGHSRHENGNGNGHSRHENGNGNGHNRHENGNGHSRHENGSGNGHSRHENGSGNGQNRHGHGNGNGNGQSRHENGNGNGQSRHENGNGQGHSRHHHSHRHRHRLAHRRHHETPIEEDCCRWLKAVDDQCVCEVLVHLPVFLARPWHRFQVVVDETCNVTYACAGRMVGV